MYIFILLRSPVPRGRCVAKVSQHTHAYARIKNFGLALVMGHSTLCFLDETKVPVSVALFDFSNGINLNHVMIALTMDTKSGTKLYCPFQSSTFT
jgi:hypothetical protein